LFHSTILLFLICIRLLLAQAKTQMGELGVLMEKIKGGVGSAEDKQRAQLMQQGLMASVQRSNAEKEETDKVYE